MGKESSGWNACFSKFLDTATNAKPSSTKKNYQNKFPGPHFSSSNGVLGHKMKNEATHFANSKTVSYGKRRAMVCKNLRLIAFIFGMMCSFFLLDSLLLTVIHHISSRSGSPPTGMSSELQDEGSRYFDEQKTVKVVYQRLLTLAASSLSKDEFQGDPFKRWEEPYKHASTWIPCAGKRSLARQAAGHAKTRTGFILVSANGGLNQQRVAVCNAVAVAALLNATLVLPRFLYSSVWKDTSQFGDIYQEDYFINLLKNDVHIVKELPTYLQSLNFGAIGSQITDMDMMKESKPIYFLKVVLPLLQRNGVVHFLGFGNRLAFDPLPSYMQRLRCKCNFHALKFVPKIQETGSLLVRRIREYDSKLTKLDKQLFEGYMQKTPLNGYPISKGPLKYLALHMRFETDMVAYSLCDFGGGEKEREELQTYREIHFPRLVSQMRNNRSFSPSELRNLGRCPLTPEEAALMLAALGFRRQTYTYLAGSSVYGGQSRMLPFTRLYPNLITKEGLLKPSELAPFKNFSSQLAALDFMVCAASDVFAMTDSGSQLSSLVTGYRVYHGAGRAPTLRPNKKRFARILSENGTVQWGEFKDRVKKMIEEGQRVRVRHRGRSIYRQPRSPGCMCKNS